ncbi:MAG: hypothetical protein L0G87_01385 [Renibacterium salmoninarum]|nr:hypothetical protein [Renibacterium salmoninarum]
MSEAATSPDQAATEQATAPEVSPDENSTLSDSGEKTEPKTFNEDYVKSLRQSEAAARVKARDAEAAANQKIKDALKALGLNDEAEDPLKAAQEQANTNAAERDAARAAARDTAAELVVWRSASELGINPVAVTDSKAFERAIKDLDPSEPSFADAVKTAATKAAETNPLLKSAQAAGASGADFTGGTGEGAITRAQFEAMTPAEKNALYSSNPTLYRTLTGR